jgi:hypothetical protein
MLKQKIIGILVGTVSVLNLSTPVFSQPAPASDCNVFDRIECGSGNYRIGDQTIQFRCGSLSPSALKKLIGDLDKAKTQVDVARVFQVVGTGASFGLGILSRPLGAVGTGAVNGTALMALPDTEQIKALRAGLQKCLDCSLKAHAQLPGKNPCLPAVPPAAVPPAAVPPAAVPPAAVPPAAAPPADGDQLQIEPTQLEPTRLDAPQSE